MLSSKYVSITRSRLANFTEKGEAKRELNLLSRFYPEKAAAKSLKVFTPLPPPGRISFEEAVKGTFRVASIGEKFGPSWATHWFDVELEVPAGWRGHEVHLLWDSECEAMLWSENGHPLQAFLGTTGDDRRAEFIVTESASGGEKLHFYVEMACTGMFGNGKWGALGPSPTDLKLEFKLLEVGLARFDRLAYDLFVDFTILEDLSKHLPEDSSRGCQAMFVANKIMNMCDVNDRSTWQPCRDLAREFLSKKNGESQHIASAVGHCHIDTAWLWSYAETKRKCARSWSTQARLCERFPDYVFGISQAQQYEWVKQLYPSLYQEVKKFVAKGQFVPLGGTWVEMDCNIPSGESLVRQFVVGQRFFQAEFGKRCNVFWLPDTFGYAAQLPQIIRGAGIEYFLTQKLSWSQFNKFPHHTFIWEGLDGSQVLTHFPPTDTYNAAANVKDTVFHLKNFKDKERCNESMMVFGHGDGGGGPVPIMLENLSRLRDVDGLPKIQMRNPEEFFERCTADAKDLSIWVGELYFEYHRGTYTTQARNKLYNRRSELLLRNIEFLSVAAGIEYPADKLLELWKLVLLNQFHDVIPGSSINEVYADSAVHYGQVSAEGGQLLDQALQGLGALKDDATPVSGLGLVFNTLAWPRTEVVEAPISGGLQQALVTVPSMGYCDYAGALVEVQPADAATVRQELVSGSDRFILENSLLRASFDSNGHLVSLIDKRLDRESIEPSSATGGNQFVMFEDIPMYWDAWDVDVYHLEKPKFIQGGQLHVQDKGPLRASLRLELSLSDASRLVQVISLDALSGRLDFSTTVQWHESRKFLKVQFPLNVRTQQATYEVPFGQLQRPTHFNTSWEIAKFEVCGQRWADMSETGFGVALLNDCKYGYSAHRNRLTLSLLRSPKAPDDEADMGQHNIRYALYPHAGTPQDAGVVRAAYAFNVPLLVRPRGVTPSVPPPRSFFEVDKPSIIVDTVKKAEDSAAVVVRLYESDGARGTVRLTTSLPVKAAALCNLLEEDDKPVQLVGDSVTLSFTPFQIITVKLSL
eukprot:TRINITY_DN2178_c0_g1_i3.p1 TRINITY_DN2178_c0_g1~~TRINITY_DN2178_c0_g1_i3.p1  ORF type:complete len:1036 (+),score=353.53 TRINITY_DN2178_c0_g1_i3:2026-5133(+)